MLMLMEALVQPVVVTLGPDRADVSMNLDIAAGIMYVPPACSVRRDRWQWRRRAATISTCGKDLGARTPSILSSVMAMTTTTTERGGTAGGAALAKVGEARGIWFLRKVRLL